MRSTNPPRPPFPALQTGLALCPSPARAILFPVYKVSGSRVEAA